MYALGCSLKIKIADHLIQCSIFSVKHDGAFDFSINQVFFVNNPKTKNLEIATSGNTGLNFVYCLWALSSAYVIVYSCNSNNRAKFFKKMPIFKKLLHSNALKVVDWLNTVIESTIMFNAKNTILYQIISYLNFRPCPLLSNHVFINHAFGDKSGSIYGTPALVTLMNDQIGLTFF